MKHSGQQGFTLVELLIVVGILGILATVAVSMYNLTLEKARLTTSVDAMNSFRRFFEIYVTDHTSYPSVMNFDDCTDGNGDAIVDNVTCGRLKKNVSSLLSYTSNGVTYELKATAIDSKRTVITITPQGVTY